MPILNFEKEIDPEEMDSAVFVLRFTKNSSSSEIWNKHKEIKQAFTNAGYSPINEKSNVLSKQSLAGNKIIIVQPMPYVHKTITLTVTEHELNEQTLQVLADLAMENL